MATGEAEQSHWDMLQPELQRSSCWRCPAWACLLLPRLRRRSWLGRPGCGSEVEVKAAANSSGFGQPWLWCSKVRGPPKEKSLRCCRTGGCNQLHCAPSSSHTLCLGSLVLPTSVSTENKGNIHVRADLTGRSLPGVWRHNSCPLLRSLKSLTDSDGPG